MPAVPSKIIHLPDIPSSKIWWKEKKIVLVGGCYDIFHYGHLVFLREAKKYGDLLFVALESDEFIKESKKRLPVHSQLQRAEILASLLFVDVVVLLPHLTSYEDYQNVVEAIRPAFVAVTKGDKQLDNKKRQVENYGGGVVEVTPLIKHYSSSKIIHDEIIFGH